MNITEQETECIIRILLGKISEQEAVINRLDDDIDKQRKVVLDYYAMLEDAKNKVADLEKQLKELQGKYDKALADIEALTESADEPTDGRPDELEDVINNCMMSARGSHPHHGQICLCLTTKLGCVASPEDFIVLKYNADADCWVTTDDDIHSRSIHDVYKYEDFVVTWWMGVDKLFRHV